MAKTAGTTEYMRFSQILENIARREGRDRITVGCLIAELGSKAHVSLILIFAALNVLPMPPGSSVLLALPMVILSWRMAHGQGVWLPGHIRDWSLPASRVTALYLRAAPQLARLERIIKPRRADLVGRRASRVAGYLLFVLSVVTMIPVPLSAIAPAFSIVIISLGLLEKDIAWIAIGATLGALSTLLFAGMIAGITQALGAVLG